MGVAKHIRPWRRTASLSTCRLPATELHGQKPSAPACAQLCTSASARVEATCTLVISKTSALCSPLRKYPSVGQALSARVCMCTSLLVLTSSTSAAGSAAHLQSVSTPYGRTDDIGSFSSQPRLKIADSTGNKSGEMVVHPQHFAPLGLCQRRIYCKHPAVPRLCVGC